MSLDKHNYLIYSCMAMCNYEYNFEGVTAGCVQGLLLNLASEATPCGAQGTRCGSTERTQVGHMQSKCLPVFCTISLASGHI